MTGRHSIIRHRPDGPEVARVILYPNGQVDVRVYRDGRPLSPGITDHAGRGQCVCGDRDCPVWLPGRKEFTFGRVSGPLVHGWYVDTVGWLQPL